MANVALVGDSHTQAIWPIVSRALTGAGLNVVLQEARPGWSEVTFRQKMPELPQRLKDARPDIVVIELGGNGYNKGAAYEEDLLWLVNAAKDAGADRIIWHGPATTAQGASDTVRARHNQAAEDQRALLPGLGVEWHDSRPLTTTDHRDDGVHFTMTGYNRWANDITSAVLAPATSGVPVGVWVAAALALVVVGAAVAHRLSED